MSTQAPMSVMQPTTWTPGRRTRVRTDLTVPVTPEQGATARTELAAAAAGLAASSQA